jgi:hypothetical protein
MRRICGGKGLAVCIYVVEYLNTNINASVETVAHGEAVDIAQYTTHNTGLLTKEGWDARSTLDPLNDLITWRNATTRELSNHTRKEMRGRK